MDLLHPHVRRLSNEAFEELKTEHGMRRCGPFELVCPSSMVSDYSAITHAFWDPVSATYLGGLISRYIWAIVAGVDREPALGVHLITPVVFLNRTPEAYQPADLCRYFLRRAIYIRQQALGVPRNLLNKRTLSARTNSFIQGAWCSSRIETAYQNYAEQDAAVKNQR